MTDLPPTPPESSPEPPPAAPPVPPVAPPVAPPAAPAAPAYAAPAAPAPGYAAPTAPADPTAPGSYAAAPAVEPRKTPLLSILALVASGIGFLGGLIVILPFVGSVLDLFFPAAGIVLGFLGRAREKQAPRWMSLVAIIVGGFCILWALGWLIGYVVITATSDYY